MECSTDVKCFYAVLVFRKNENNEGTFVQYAPTSIIGTELLVITPIVNSLTGAVRSVEQGDIDKLAYFSELSTMFGAATAATRRYTEDSHFALSIKISEVEHTRLQTYLVALARCNIPYCAGSVPFMCVPSPIQWFFRDVASERPTSFQTLTSTQAVLFSLRNSLEHDRSVVSALQNIQSRFVSPSRLYWAVEPFSRPCKVLPLNIAKVVRKAHVQ
jgi:hypothetical protein